MPIATGVAKVLALKKESTWGTLAGPTGAQVLRRRTSDISLAKDTYQSEEIRTDYQIADFRHGAKRVEGSIEGELSPGSYQLPIQAALRRIATAVSALTGLSLTIAASGSAWTITRGSGDFISGGVRVGHVIRLTAGTFNAANLNKNLLVIALTTTVATVIPLDGSSLFAEGPIASATVTIPGRYTYVPATGQTDESYTIEHWHPDVAQSERFVGCKFTRLDFDLPPTGMSTIRMQVLGRDMSTGTAAYFTSPTAASTSGVCAAATGALSVGGVPVGLLTGLNITIDGNYSAEPVVGSNLYPDIFEGSVNVSGQASVYFENATMRDYFVNESEVSLAAAFSAGGAANAEFVAICMPRVKFGGVSKSDGQKGLVMTMPFQALLNSAAGGEATTIQVHDSLFA